MLALLDEDVRHEVNQGEVRRGRDAFRSFLEYMARCHDERLRDVVVMVADDGRRAAAEFVVDGTYLATAPGMPKARGQRYRLRAGSFFEIENGRIVRITTCYNLPDWLRQVAG